MPQFPVTLSLGSLDGTNGFKITGAWQYWSLGGSIASAGDVNGDGYNDIIIGSGNVNGSVVVYGLAAGYSVPLDVGTLNGSNGFIIDNLTDPAQYIGRVVSAGDINGDGRPDLIVTTTSGDSNTGYIYNGYVVFGTASLTPFTTPFDVSTLNGANGFKIGGSTGFGSPWAFGNAEAVGDINGDGIQDFTVGVFQGDPTDATRTGRTYVVFGKAGGYTASFDPATVNGTTGFRLDGVNAEDRSGGSIANAGDVNGDGFADLLIGRYYNVNTLGSVGQAYVVFGHSGAFSPTLGLANLNGTNGFRINGVATGGDVLGSSIASAGDVNGDGYADVVIGASETNGERGAAYVIFGKASGFAADVNVSSLDGTNGFRIDGLTSPFQLGGSVASAGDLNGDGFADIIVGAPGEFGNQTTAGAAYVIFGKAGGFAPVISVASLDGDNGFVLTGEGVRDFAGGAVSAVGDVNGDGVDDIGVTAPGLGNGANNQTGFAYIIYGALPTVSVTRVGTDIANKIWGGTANDSISGLGGNDTLMGTAGSDFLDGGSGTDTADYTYLSSGIVASVQGTNGTVTKGGGVGTDTLVSVERIVGTKFNDVFYIDAAEAVAGGAGFNTLIELSSGVAFTLGDANHTSIQEIVLGGGINVVGVAAADTDFTYLYGGSGTNTLTTGSGGGYEISTGGSNHMFGSGGTNVFIGGVGASDMHGGDGANVYYTGASDTVSGAGTYNTDVLLANSVTLSLGASHIQQVILNGGANSVDMTGSTDFVYLYGGTGTNTMTLGAGGGYELSTGGVNHMHGGSSGAGTNVFVGGGGASDMHGGAGANVYYVGANDTVAGAGAYNTLVELATNVNLTLGSAGLTGVQQFILNGGTNTLDGSAATSQLIIYGGAGNDTLKGGTGNDFVWGEGGANTFQYGLNWGGDTIVDWASGSGNIIDLTAIASTGVHALGDLTQTITGGNDVITSSHTGGNSITLLGVSTALATGNFHFA